ncbi:MAG: hypothetical protein WA761_07050 [Thermoplasmata archaeon]
MRPSEGPTNTHRFAPPSPSDDGRGCDPNIGFGNGLDLRLRNAYIEIRRLTVELNEAHAEMVRLQSEEARRMALEDTADVIFHLPDDWKDRAASSQIYRDLCEVRGVDPDPIGGPAPVKDEGPVIPGHWSRAR